MKQTKRPSAISDRIKVREKLNSLENYLMSCPNHCEMYQFPGDANAAYEFGKKLRGNAMQEEGVDFPDQLQKFKIDISYETVRISLVVVEELARR